MTALPIPATPSMTEERQTQLSEALAERDELRAHQAAVADILRLMSGPLTDVAPVFEAITKLARTISGSRVSFAIHVKDDLRQTIAVCGCSPEVEAEMRAAFATDPGSESLYARFIAGPVPLQIPDIELDPAYQLGANAKKNYYRALLTVPLLHEDGHAIGAIGIGREEPGLFPCKLIGLLQTFASQAVIALANVRNFNETKFALERQAATADILKAIANSPSDAQSVFDAIATRSNGLVRGMTTTVYSIAANVIDLKAFTPSTPEADSVLQASFPRPLSSFPFGESILKGEILEFSDVEADWAGTPDFVEIARLRGFQSLVYIPLRRNKTVVGVISVTCAAPGRFAANHLQLLDIFAAQAVIAIGNAGMLNETKEALERQTAMVDILRVISQSPNDVHPVLDAVAKAALRLCGGKDALIVLRDGEEMVTAAHEGELDASIGHRRSYDRTTINGRAILDRRLVLIADADLIDATAFPDVLEMSPARGWRAGVATPILREDVTVGVIMLRKPGPGAFTARQIVLLQTFAAQAVIAIENVRLFDALQARTKELTGSLDDLRRAQDRLIQSEKLASLGQLTAGIAHEIKNPLNFVNNFASLSVDLLAELQEEIAPGLAALDEGQRAEVEELSLMLTGNLRKITEHGKRADGIVRSMLEHSRGASGERQAVDLNAVAEEALNLAYHGARASMPGFNITMDKAFDPSVGQVELFGQEFTRVLLNLIGNGFYATAKRAERGSAAKYEPTLRLATRNLGDHVEIRVRDNGIGMTAAVRDRIFEPFFTTKPTGEGTGLGLSLSYDIILKQLGGQIEVESEVDDFTEFVVRLPRRPLQHKEVNS